MQCYCRKERSPPKRGGGVRHSGRGTIMHENFDKRLELLLEGLSLTRRFL
ncbi:hypothetical protein DU19_0818 [Chlamydia muridarum]|nr:hypothetical protein DU17_0820 [Chlamydia muridarum]KDU82289.1 hypothetical protein DU19_0818 [Chlamydia muridarum]KDU83721.1 hypothetical protein DU20_0818 [Chlamydia muridarum]KDU84647.1 hypothetical protein DU21_0820 [Chlamydia muridarum]